MLQTLWVFSGWLYFCSAAESGFTTVLQSLGFGAGMLFYVNPHQRCGYSDSPFARKDTFLYCRVRKSVGKGSRRRPGTHKRKLYLVQRHFFVIEKYIEDVKQDEKDVPDLLESIMRPTDHVKEELQRILIKMR